MYTNIPVKETITILKDNLIHSAKLNKQKIEEIITLLQITLKQNYFTFNNQFYNQDEGLAMGSPLSGLLADIYLNHFENKHILSKLNQQQKNIVFYARYVDDTFVIFNGTNRQIDILNNYINNINNKIKFTCEIEQNNAINFLDLNINKNNNKLQFKIYRKPTTTDITIHNDSHHPFTQKIAAYNAFINRLINIPLTKKDYDEEVNTIKHIAITNGYKPEMIDKLIYKKKKKIKNQNKTNNNINNPTTNTKYIAIEYTNILPQIIKNEFKKHNINISFKTNNNIQTILKPKTKKDTKTCSGVYKINCDDCEQYYIGQTGRTFYERFTEHKPKHNTKSTYALHLIDKNHNYTSFETNLQPLHFC